MPAIVGSVNVNVMSGVFNIGDVHTIAPAQFLRILAGGGSFTTGQNVNVNNASSVINIYGDDAYEETVFAPEYASTMRGGNNVEFIRSPKYCHPYAEN